MKLKKRMTGDYIGLTNPTLFMDACGDTLCKFKFSTSHNLCCVLCMFKFHFAENCPHIVPFKLLLEGMEGEGWIDSQLDIGVCQMLT